MLTPGSILKKRIEEKIKDEALKVKLIEFTGPKILDIVQQKVGGGNNERCEQECFICNGEKGGKCRRRGVCYEIWCRTCAAQGIKSAYIGETGNCANERGAAHWKEYQSKNPETRKKSVLRRHVEDVHEGREEGIEFDMKVTDVFKYDATGRQVMEGAKIRESNADHVMNSMLEFHQPGEIVAVFQGARRTFSNNNNNNVREKEGEENLTTDGGSAQREVTTDCGDNGGRGVITRSQARRQNIVV